MHFVVLFVLQQERAFEAPLLGLQSSLKPHPGLHGIASFIDASASWA